MKSVIISGLVLATLFIGCESSGGICCDSEFEEQQQEQQEVYLAPVAVLDYNETRDDFLTPYIFSCVNSYDRDENNQSIVRCDWNITITEDGYSFSYERNNTQEANYTIDTTPMPGTTIFVKLKVTDDENQIAEANRTITVDEY